MSEIQWIGIELLNEKQKQLATKLLKEYLKKIQRQLKNKVKLEFHIKEYERAGKPVTKKEKAKKFSIHIRVIAPTRIFEADYADWDLARTVHKVMNKLMNEIEKKFHVSEQHTNLRKPQQVRKR